jgi:hypothetical protein
MAKRLEVIISAGEIVIRSSVKHIAPDRLQRKRIKGRRTSTSAGS